MLAAAGVALALAPGAPQIRLDPHTALALFIAPVLVDAAYDFPLGDIRRLWRPLFALARGGGSAQRGRRCMAGRGPRRAAALRGAGSGRDRGPAPNAAAATAVLSSVRMPAPLGHSAQGREPAQRRLRLVAVHGRHLVPPSQRARCDHGGPARARRARRCLAGDRAGAGAAPYHAVRHGNPWRQHLRVCRLLRRLDPGRAARRIGGPLRGRLRHDHRALRGPHDAATRAHPEFRRLGCRRLPAQCARLPADGLPGAGDRHRHGPGAARRGRGVRRRRGGLRDRGADGLGSRLQYDRASLPG